MCRLFKDVVLKSVEATLIIPVDDIKLQTELVKSIVRSRKSKWTSYRKYIKGENQNG